MSEQQAISVRRAKPGDAEAIAAFVNRILAGKAGIDRAQVLERFGNVGLLLAEGDGRVIGILGWRAENLVVRVTDLLIWPASQRATAARALLGAMEKAAYELQCEAALLLPPRKPTTEHTSFFSKLGYELRAVADLPRAWREASREAGFQDGDSVLTKELRTDRVLRPL